MDKKKLLFIASYPKSGNTFMRAIISSLIYSEYGNFNFELFKKITLIDTNPFYDFVKTKNNNDFFKLNDLRISCKYWLEAQDNYSKLTKNFIFKTHAANLMLQNHKYTTEENCMGVIYLVRNPIGIIPSYAYHLNTSNDEILKMVKNSKTISLNPKENICVPLSSWDTHVISWSKINVPIIFVRFEDMITDTKGTIFKCIEFLKSININFTHNSTKIENIYKSTKFEIMEKSEELSNFKIGKDKNFFRKGSLDNSDVNSNIKEELKNAFGKTMEKFNYL
tara:strand:- start:533 stop:1369 length:837 start_codon:yes stop_codon:yes gene_type:complete